MSEKSIVGYTVEGFERFGIKMDIEGAEYDAIIGATETIRKFRPNLITSIYHTPKDFFEIKIRLLPFMRSSLFEIDK